MGLTVKVKQANPGTVMLSPVGSLDSQTYRILNAEITGVLAQPVETLILDLAEVDFITSAAVGVIIKTKTALTQRNADFAMVNLQPQVRKVFDIMELLPTLNVFADMAELDEYLGKVQRRITEDEEF